MLARFTAGPAVAGSLRCGPTVTAGDKGELVAEIETDYLVIGAGASGMAYTDALIGNAEVDVVMVDRRYGPGGHWNDAYPFVRLHQPSATYGVTSRALGTETIDATGLNAGFYERATGVEICDYFRRVLEDQLLGSGQVRFFGQSDYLGHQAEEHTVRSRLTGATTTVRVRQQARRRHLPRDLRTGDPHADLLRRRRRRS